MKNTKKFSIISNFLSLKKAVALYLTKLNSLQLNMLCTKFGWNWHGAGEEVENVSLSTDSRQTNRGQTDTGQKVIR